MIENINLSDLENNQDLKKNFFTANLSNLNERCTYFSGNFFLDPLNYYPITEEFKSFNQLFTRIDKNSVAHYHSDTFFNNLKNK